MLWAQNVFITDTKKKNWPEVLDEFGPAVETSLRTLASSLRSVKTSDLKNPKDRPVNYKTWLKKIIGKVFLHFKIFYCI